MARNDFSAEEAENYEQKCLCVLVLDISGSMNEIVDATNTISTGKTVYVDGKQYEVVQGGTTKLDCLNKGLESFYNDIKNDDTTGSRLEISVITFNDKVTIVQEPALIFNCERPVLEADGDTAMVDAMNEAIGLVEARKKWYKETNQPYYRPWIIMITDGEPNKGQDISSLSIRIKQDMENKKYVFMPIGVDNADMKFLSSIQGDIPAMKLQGAKFASFFKWLSASMATVVTSEEGTKVDLSDGGTDWMERFSI